MAFKHRVNIVMNKDKIRDALKQCLEDYMLSAENAIKEHKIARAMLLIGQQHDQGMVIEKCQERIKLLMAALEELT